MIVSIYLLFFESAFEFFHYIRLRNNDQLKKQQLLKKWIQNKKVIKDGEYHGREIING